MRLIVGLGNYLEKYKNTRHNFGFLAVEYLVEKYGFSEWKSEKKFFSECAYGQIGAEKTIICKPQTFMNLSGKSVSAIKNFFQISESKIWVISDDLDQEFGKSRIREHGSDGGQKGVKSVIESIGTQNFPRLKFGISNAERKIYKTEDFVLSKFSETEKECLPQIIRSGCEKLEKRILGGILE